MATLPYEEFEADDLQREIWTAANALRAAGLNPLETVEHVSLLMLLRLAEASTSGLLGELKAASSLLQTMALSSEVSSHKRPAAFFNEQLFPELRDTAAQLGSPALAMVFEGFTPRITDDRALLHALTTIERMSLNVAHVDVNGAVYERLVGTISDAGYLGQYFTPRHLVDAMVAVVDPQPGESIYDPAAGTGGFLIRAASAERRDGPASAPHLFGREINATARRLCVINLLIHGLDPDGVEAGDSLVQSSQVVDAYDIVLTNPPFGVTVTAPEVMSAFPIQARAAEALFVQHVVTALKPGGRAAIVCPEGLLANVGTMRDLRQWVMHEASVEMVLSLPGGVFLPYTGVRTGVVVIRKTGPTKRIWFFDARSDGFTLDVKRAPTGHSDLPAVVAGFKRMKAGEQSTAVATAALAENGDRFIASRYLGRKRSSAKPMVAVGDVATFRKSARLAVASSDEELFYLALEHITSRTGEIVGAEPVQLASLRSQKSRFCEGDVLYGKLRPYLAKVVVAPCDGICSTELLVLVPDREQILGEYLAHMVRSQLFTEEATRLMVGANHPRLHPGDLLKIELPLLCVEEQLRFVETVRELQQQIDDATRRARELRADLDERVDSLW
jgi:type I restriction enzyme M protein